MLRWIKWLLPVGVSGCGVLVLLAGLLYDLAFAGIPYQDPPPELAARYALHSNIATAVEGAGLLIAALGLIGLLVVTVWALVKTRRR